MPFKYLDVRREGAVEYLTLNRPDVRNAFNDGVVAELTWWADAVEADRSVRAVVLAGAGRSFCAGADVEWMRRMADATRQENLADAQEMARLFLSLDRLRCPIVGRIHGAALGGGAGLVAVCDVAVAAEDTTLGFTEVRLGIIPAVISPFVIAKIGRSAARELFLTGSRFTAARAQAIGLVHDVVPAAGLDARVAERVRDVLAAGPEAVAAAKALVADVARRAPADCCALTAEAIAERRVSAEGQEGLRAFLEKRPPRWAE